MTLHVLALPHTRIGDPAHAWCAYTAKVHKFTRMFPEAVVYGPELDDPPPGYVTVLHRADQERLCDPTPGFTADPAAPVWQFYNATTVHELRPRLDDGDLLLVTYGTTQKPVADALPCRAVEWGIGYGGTFARYRVYESHAWAHACTVADAVREGRPVDAADGCPDHTVIPNFFDPGDFEVGDEPADPYFLYLGRLIDRKGVREAAAACETAGVRLVLAGQGDVVPSGDLIHHVGHADPRTRRELLSRATGLLAPTRYLEPFGGVAVEALLSGVPVIASAWGAFTETIRDGDGTLVSTQDDLAAAVRSWAVEPWDRRARDARRQRAVDRFSIDAVRPLFQRYFDRIREDR